MRELPKKGEIWHHFKGKEYQILTIARHTETEEEFVVYTALANGKDFLRPLAMFMSEVDRAKYPNAQQKYRFEKLSCDL